MSAVSVLLMDEVAAGFGSQSQKAKLGEEVPQDCYITVADGILITTAL